MTTPTPNEPPPGESPAPEEPNRDEIAVTTDSDEGVVQAAAQKDELETTSHVVTSDAPLAESEKAEPEEGAEAEADATASSKKATDAASSETDDDTQAGTAAEPEDTASGEGPEGEPEKLGRRARKMKRLQAKIDAQETEITELRAKATQSDDGAGDKPEPDDSPSWEEYADKLADWKVAERDAQAATTAPAKEAGDQGLPESWGEVQDGHDDYDEIAFNEDLKVSQPMVDALMAMEAEGAELLYQLGKHPEEAKRIATVRGESAVARELGKFEAMVAAESPGKPQDKTNGKQPGAGKAADAPTRSSAPKPITRTEGGTGSSAATADPDKMSPTEYRIWREGTRPQG